MKKLVPMNLNTITQLSYDQLALLNAYLEYLDALFEEEEYLPRYLPSLPEFNYGPGQLDVVDTMLQLDDEHAALIRIRDEIPAEPTRGFYDLKQAVAVILKMVEPVQPDYSNHVASRRHLLQGSVTWRVQEPVYLTDEDGNFVYHRGRRVLQSYSAGPFGEFRYYAVSQGATGKRRKYKSKYLGKSFGSFLMHFQIAIDDMNWPLAFRKAVHNGIVHAFQTDRLMELKTAVGTSTWSLNNQALFNIMIEQQLHTRFLEQQERNLSAQEQAAEMLDALLWIYQNLRDVRKEAFFEYQRRSGMFAPSVSIDEAIEELTGREPMLRMETSEDQGNS